MSAADAIPYSLLCCRGLDTVAWFPRMSHAFTVDCMQVLERANKSEYGLAAGIFSKDVDTINALSRCFICLFDCVFMLLLSVQPHSPVDVHGFLLSFCSFSAFGSVVCNVMTPGKVSCVSMSAWKALSRQTDRQNLCKLSSLTLLDCIIC